MRYLASAGMTEKDVGGAGIIMVDAVVVYRSEIFYGETLRIDVGTTAHHSLGCDFVYRISGVDAGKEAARGKTGIVFFDYEKRKVVPMPTRFREAMAPGT
jgi:acyl-CoA thioester hydrolase